MGLPGSGKTTLLNHILSSTEHKMKFAIVENEFGDIGIDENIYNKSWGVFRLEGPDITTIGKISNEIEYKMYSGSGNILGDDLLGRLLIRHLGNRSLQVEVFTVNSNDNVLKFTDNSKIYTR